MTDLVAVDASPLIGLALVGSLDVLRDLFGTVTVTRAVRDEIMAGSGRPGATELDAAMREGWIRVAPTPMGTWQFQDLGAGEASTIALALEHSGPARVLMDDALGLERAAALGIAVLGTADVLAAAKRAGRIEALKPLLDRLARRGFTLPAEALQRALEAVDES